MKKIVAAVILLSILFFNGSFNKQQSSVTGAWHMNKGKTEAVLIYKDGYFVHTMFNKVDKKFIFSSGGTYKVKKGQLIYKIEFDTKAKEYIGKEVVVDFTISGDKMTMPGNDDMKRELTQLDDGTGALAGNWRITGRMNDGQIRPMQQGARKTLKLLSGTRFQWMAINPETKEFSGTGGGTYTFKDGKYTENIEFFSRDSSRVGASLTFDGSVNKNVWTHKGTNSRGEALHEEWTRQ